MTWAQQAQSMMDIWTETQKTMWQSWYDAVQSASTSAMMNPSIAEEWRKLAEQGMGMWTTGSEPMFKNMSSQFLASQGAMMRLLQTTTSAWQSMAPKLDAGENWQEVVKNYSEMMRQQLMPNTAGMQQATKDTLSLWRMYLEQLQNVAQPWSGILQQAPGFMGGVAGGKGSSDLIELTRMAWNAYDKTLGSLKLSPSFGFTRELEEKMAKAFDTWQEMTEASNEYQILMAEAWSGVFEQVMLEMKKRADEGKPIASLRDLMRLWTDSADRSFDQIFRTDNYSEVQARFVNATMTYRLHEQAVVEEMMKATYVPTRSEMDEAHRNIYQLRREVRALNASASTARGRAGPGKMMLLESDM